jgi:hypothetical protein
VEDLVMKDVKTYKAELVNRIIEVKNIDRSKHFTKEEIALIDKVYNSVLQIIELEIDED